MERILVELYDTCMAKARKDSPAYQKAMAWWERVKPAGALELEDAVESWVYEWGLLSFAAGARLGLGLAASLEALEEEPAP